MSLRNGPTLYIHLFYTYTCMSTCIQRPTKWTYTCMSLQNGPTLYIHLFYTYICMSLQNGPTHVVTCIQRPTKWTYTYMYTETYEMALHSIYTYFIHVSIYTYFILRVWMIKYVYTEIQDMKCVYTETYMCRPIL